MLSVAALSGLMFACQNEDALVETSQASKPIEVVNLVSGKIVRGVADDATTQALSFATENDYQSTLTKLKTMSSEEKLAFTDQLGFVSLQKLAEIADEELEKIADEATDENDFRTKYAEYKAKYSPYLAFNKYDETDLSAYVPEGDNESSYLVGANHTLLINQNVKTIDFTNEMNAVDKSLYATPHQEFNESEISTMSLAPESQWPINSFIIKNGKQKTIFSARVETFNDGSLGYLGRKSLYFYFGAQKKMWYGWKDDGNRTIFFQYSMSSAYRFDLEPNVKKYNGADSYFCDKIKYDNRMGSQSVGTTFVGKIYAWTDATITGHIENPVLDKNNSMPCKINLAATRD